MGETRLPTNSLPDDLNFLTTTSCHHLARQSVTGKHPREGCSQRVISPLLHQDLRGKFDRKALGSPSVTILYPNRSHFGESEDRLYMYIYIYFVPFVGGSLSLYLRNNIILLLSPYSRAPSCFCPDYLINFHYPSCASWRIDAD